MRQLSEDDLRAFAEAFRRQLGGSPQAWTYIMAMEAVAAYLDDETRKDDKVGPQWALGNMGGHGPTLSDDYFRRERADGSTQQRRIELADMLFNLQAVPGIDRLLDTLRKDTIESAVAELHAGKLLYLSRIPFRYVLPSQTKGSDFDAQIDASDGSSINCEMKCKLEATGLTEGTVVDSLNRARAQLPRNAPNVAFVRLPSQWVSTPDAEETITKAVQSFYGRSNRIAAIVFHWDVYFTLEDGRMARMTMHRVFPNGASEHIEIVDRELNSRLLRPRIIAGDSVVLERPHHWRYLHEIANEMQ